MTVRLRVIGSDLSVSYWFVPAIMSLLAAMLAVAMVFVDSRYGSGWMDRIAWLYKARPDGARTLLSSVSSAMIGVAGTTFSITIAAVVYASGQFGPRLLSNFAADRGNQATLGTLIATIVYSLIVLRTIRSPGDGGAFVPQAAMLVAMVLTLASIAMLVYFIHHVTQRIHINSVIEQIGTRLIRDIDKRFPVFVGEPADEADHDRIPAALRPDGEARRAGDVEPVCATRVGYIEAIDDKALLKAAVAHDLVIRMHFRPGDFVHAGSLLLEVWPAKACDDRVATRLRAALIVGKRRTPLQDFAFLIDELVEIAARALSPGINDPFTAVSCLDWLSAAFADLVRRELPSWLRADDNGNLRVIARPMRFAQIVERSFGGIAQYASADLIAGLHYLAAIGEVVMACDMPDRRLVLRRQVEDFRALGKEHLDGVSRDRLLARADEVLRACDDPAFARLLRDRGVWLGGTA